MNTQIMETIKQYESWVAIFLELESINNGLVSNKHTILILLTICNFVTFWLRRRHSYDTTIHIVFSCNFCILRDISSISTFL